MYLINQILFSRFPREIGIKYPSTKQLRIRKRVNSWRQIHRYIEKYNGLAHIYISAYSLDHVIDKIVYDVDSINLQESLNATLQLLDVLKKHDVRTIVVFSGKKGFHVYALFKPWTAPDEDTMTVVVKNVYDYFWSQLDADAQRIIDTKVKHSKVLIRIPNTLHPETLKYAVPMPPRFEDMTVKEILEYASQPHDVDEIQIIGMLRDIREYVDLTRQTKYEVIEIPSFGTVQWSGEITDIDKFLIRLVRPCVVYYSHNPDADHFIRTTLSVELSWLDFTPEEQVKIFRKLGWTDFKYSVSLYHASRIYEKVKSGQLFPPSCHTLRKMGYCLGNKCPFYPAYFYWWGIIS